MGRHAKTLVAERELQLDVLGSEDEDEKGPHNKATDKWIAINTKAEKRHLKALRASAKRDERANTFTPQGATKFEGLG